MTEIINPEQKYRIVSLKKTQKDDRWILLWGPNNNGYFHSKEESGIYHGYISGYHDTERSQPITEELASSLFKWRQDEDGIYQWVIPNTSVNRRIIGIHIVNGHLEKLQP